MQKTTSTTKPTLSIIQGFLGAGKTTFAKRLAKQEDALRLNADEWCTMHYTREDLEKNWDACFAKSVENLWAQAIEQLEQGSNVIMDLGFWSLESRDYARKIAQTTKAHFAHYYVSAPDVLLIKRLAKRKGSIARDNQKRFSLLKASFEEPRPHEKHILVQTKEVPFFSTLPLVNTETADP